MVIGALTIELFLKCFICLETGNVPRGHNLKELFDQPAPTTQTRILQTWDNDIVIHRAAEWDRIEASLCQKIFRDLPTALSAAGKVV